MKPYFLLILMILFALSAYEGRGQNDSLSRPEASKAYSREIGFNAYSLTVRGGDFYSGYKHLIDNYAASGLYFKRYWGQNGLRFAADYLQKISNQKDFFEERDKAISFRSLQLKVGYQRLLGGKRWSPYFFADLAFTQSNQLLRSIYDGGIYYNNNLMYPSYSNYFTRKTAMLSASPGLGLRIRLKQQLRLNLEAGAQFFYMRERSSHYTSVGINANPFSCSLGFTF